MQGFANPHLYPTTLLAGEIVLLALGVFLTVKAYNARESKDSLTKPS